MSMTRAEYLFGLVERANAMRQAPPVATVGDPKIAYLRQLARLAGPLVHQSPSQARAEAALIDRFRQQVTNDVPAFIQRVSERIDRRVATLPAASVAILYRFELAPDLFAPLDFTRAETSHTRVVAWALSPSRLHASLCDRPLRAFLSLLNERGARCGDFVGTDLSRVRAAPERWAGEFGRVDIWLSLPGWEIPIEAKIDADERENQVSDYNEAIDYLTPSREGFPVFLTIDGHDSESEAITVSFADLSRAWLPIAFAGESADHLYLRAYIKSVLVNLYHAAATGAFGGWPWLARARFLAYLATQEVQ